MFSVLLWFCHNQSAQIILLVIKFGNRFSPADKKKKNTMIRISGAHIFNMNLPLTRTCVRRICVNSSLQLNKSKSEALEERKRRDQEIKWTRLYQFNDMKYHAIVTRLKIYPFFSTVILTPLAYALKVSDLFPEISAIPCLVIGTFLIRTWFFF